MAMAAGTVANAALFSVELEAERPQIIHLPWLCDDRNLGNPSDYSAPEEKGERVVRKVTLQVEGDDPLVLWSLEVNQKDYFSQPWIKKMVDESLRSASPVQKMYGLWKIYDWWRDQRHHGSTNLRENSDPWAILNLWGASICGDDARAFAGLLKASGIPSRRIPMNLHEVNEYLVNGLWVVLDTDQQVFYPNLDGVTPASFQNLREDPFLVLRAKPFGKRASWNPCAAWWNLALFDFAANAPVFPGTAGRAVFVKREPYALFPGEKVDFHYDPNSPPNGNMASSNFPFTRTVQLHCDALKRKQSGINLALPYPILRGDWGVKPLFLATTNQLESAGVEGMESYGAVKSFPEFHAGSNTIVLKTLDGKGRGRLTIDYSDDAAQRKVPCPPGLRILSVAKGTPEIGVDAPGAQELCWQISPDGSFGMVPPNFDKWEEGLPFRLIINNPVEQTFLISGKQYFVRARCKVSGLWSEWSKAISFSIIKPEAPGDTRCESGSKPGTTILKWKPCRGKIMIYGSNRADFLPEIYLGKIAARGINKGGGLEIELEDDKNRLAEVDGEIGSAMVQLRDFYRMIRNKDDALSLPTPLLRVSKSLMKDGMQIFARSKKLGVDGDVVAQPVDFR